MVGFTQRLGNFYPSFKKMLVKAVCLMMVTVAVWGGLWIPGAMAAGSQKAADVMNERAAAELDRVSGAGTSDQLEGTVQKTVGKAKRGMGRMADDVEDASNKDAGSKLGNKLNNAADRLDGSANELKGQMKRDIGRAKAAAADVGDDVEDKTQGVVQSIKDFFE